MITNEKDIFLLLIDHIQSTKFFVKFMIKRCIVFPWSVKQ